MKLEFFGKPDGSGLSAVEIKAGHTTVYADVICPHCGKRQPVAATHHIGGPCVRCGLATSGISE